VSVALSAPEPFGTQHQIGDFNSGVASLEEWLKRRALANQASGAARTFVVCEANKIVGYYALASGAVNVAAAPGRFRRNMPDPIPVVVLARLAVDQTHQSRGIGRALVRDGARRVVHAADAIGIRGILVHAISAEAKAFYLSLGFDPSPIEPMTLMVTLADVRKSIE
jgi:GNAT superfamily N-acetyltransferase